MVDTSLALRLIQGKPWHHDFEIVPGVRTHGSYNPMQMWNELQLPEDLRGTTLADVGASNGYFSFEARRRGARVTAFDFRHKDNSGFGLAQHINGMSDIEHHHVNVLDIKARRTANTTSCSPSGFSTTHRIRSWRSPTARHCHGSAC